MSGRRSAPPPTDPGIGYWVLFDDEMPGYTIFTNAAAVEPAMWAKIQPVRGISARELVHDRFITGVTETLTHGSDRALSEAQAFTLPAGARSFLREGSSLLSRSASSRIDVGIPGGVGFARAGETEVTFEARNTVVLVVAPDPAERAIDAARLLYRYRGDARSPCCVSGHRSAAAEGPGPATA